MPKLMGDWWLFALFAMWLGGTLAILAGLASAWPKSGGYLLVGGLLLTMAALIDILDHVMYAYKNRLEKCGEVESRG